MESNWGKAVFIIGLLWGLFFAFFVRAKRERRDGKEETIVRVGSAELHFPGWVSPGVKHSPPKSPWAPLVPLVVLAFLTYIALVELGVFN